MLGQIWRNYCISEVVLLILQHQEPGVPVDFAITFVKLALAVRAYIQYSLTLGDGKGTSGTLWAA